MQIKTELVLGKQNSQRSRSKSFVVEASLQQDKREDKYGRV